MVCQRAKAEVVVSMAWRETIVCELQGRAAGKSLGGGSRVAGGARSTLTLHSCNPEAAEALANHVSVCGGPSKRFTCLHSTP